MMRTRSLFTEFCVRWLNLPPPSITTRLEGFKSNFPEWGAWFGGRSPGSAPGRCNSWSPHHSWQYRVSSISCPKIMKSPFCAADSFWTGHKICPRDLVNFYILSLLKKRARLLGYTVSTYINLVYYFSLYTYSRVYILEMTLVLGVDDCLSLSIFQLTLSKHFFSRYCVSKK